MTNDYASCWCTWQNSGVTVKPTSKVNVRKIPEFMYPERRQILWLGSLCIEMSVPKQAGKIEIVPFLLVWLPIWSIFQHHLGFSANRLLGMLFLNVWYWHELCFSI